MDAILAFNDLVAVGALQACEDMGRKVPDDVAIIGADDIPIATMLRPRLTTLHIDLSAVGAQALALVLSMISSQSNGAGTAYQIDPELVIRESA